MRVLLLALLAATLGIGLLGPAAREPTTSAATVQEALPSEEAYDPLAPICPYVPDPARDFCPAQHDGNQTGDASDDCSLPSPVFTSVPLDFEGWLLAPVDPEDNYGVVLQPSPLPLVANVTSALPLPPGLVQHKLEVWAPGPTHDCATLLGTARPGAPLAFNATVTGTYTLRVLPDSALEPALLSSVAAQNCHMMCLLQDVTGYRITIYP